MQNLEGQSLAGIVVGSGSNFLIEGNEIEGIGGPAIVVWGMSNAVAIVGNYFATDDEGFKNSNRDGGCPSYFPDCVGNQTYGPLVLQPHCDGGCTGSPPNITAFADVVINGCLAAADCKLPRSWHLGCILLKMPAISLDRRGLHPVHGDH